MSATSSRCSRTGSASTLTYCWLMASGSSSACSPSSLNRAAMACRSAVVFAPSGSSACHSSTPAAAFAEAKKTTLTFMVSLGVLCRRSLYCVRLRALRRLHKGFVEIGRCASAGGVRALTDATASLICHGW